MVDTTVEETILRTASTTYAFSVKFFPKDVRGDVLRLHSFLRVVDDLVDGIRPRTQEFSSVYAAWQTANNDPGFDATPRHTDTIDERVIKNIVGLSRSYDFKPVWVAAFWKSMQADMDGVRYETFKDSLAYVYGSAEVVGLMMARLMGVPDRAYRLAKLQGRALQWINFIRDIQQDNALGRCYFPAVDLARYELADLSVASAKANSKAFRRFVQFELSRYQTWQTQALPGLIAIPAAMRPAVQQAIALYDWTADQIAQDPFVVYSHKVKPTLELLTTLS